MKLQDLLPNETAIDLSKKTVEKLSTKKNLSTEETERLKEAQRLISTQKMVRKMIAAIGVAGACSLVGYGVYSGTKEDPTTQNTSAGASADSKGNNQPVQVKLQPETGPDKIQQIDSVIKEAEASMDNLEKAVSPQLEQIKDKELRETLIQAFELMKINASNPNKNYSRMKQRLANSSGVVRQDNINYFSYELEEEKGFAASYYPPYRYVKLERDYDGNNLLDALVFFHECQHIMHDTLVRTRLDTKQKFDEYIGSYIGSQKRDKMLVNLPGEGTAYAIEIELLNLLLDGKLKEGNPPSVEDIIKLLNAKPDQDETVKILLELADVYYSTGIPVTKGVHKTFLKKIAGFYDPKTTEMIWNPGPYL